MIYVLCSVLCSVSVAILLKLAKERGVNRSQAIVWNYPTALVCAYFFFSPSWPTQAYTSWPWALYVTISLLMLSLFVCIARAIQYSGIVKTEVAQRLSLFIPLLASFFIFGEHLSGPKSLGVLVGLTAIGCSIGWHKGVSPSGGRSWWYALIVFVGMGLIDVLFKQVALHRAVNYTAALTLIFALAMGWGFCYLAYLLLQRKESFSWGAIGWGIGLGLLNFGNIACYMLAHAALPENPSIVFTAMNIGVIAVGALVGVGLFKEKLTRLNWIGVFLAVISVLVFVYL